MYEPIPGYSHLKLFLAPHRVRYGRLPTSAEVAAQHRIQKAGFAVFHLFQHLGTDIFTVHMVDALHPALRHRQRVGAGEEVGELLLLAERV